MAQDRRRELAHRHQGQAPSRPLPTAKPDLTKGQPIPDPEDFAAWCENPVTRFVASAYVLAAEANKREWMAMSWEGGNSDPQALNSLRVRSDCYLAFTETNYEQFLKMVKDER